MEGADEFIAGLAAYGAAPTILDHFITYQVEVVQGRFAGQAAETAVALDELARWPLVPPHWIYLHNDVTFDVTNTQMCPLLGWVGHSRQIVGWGTDPDPIAGWMAHVRGVIGEST